MCMVFLHYIWDILESPTVKYLDWTRFRSRIAEVESRGSIDLSRVIDAILIGGQVGLRTLACLLISQQTQVLMT